MSWSMPGKLALNLGGRNVNPGGHGETSLSFRTSKRSCSFELRGTHAAGTEHVLILLLADPLSVGEKIHLIRAVAQLRPNFVVGGGKAMRRAS